MALEIERKFLLKDESWRHSVERSIRMVQGYLCEGEGHSVRVRIEDESAFLNLKASADGIHRHEFEYEVPTEEAREMLDKLALYPVIEKVRHILFFDGYEWEIDVYSGANQGLVVAEVELAHADKAFALPSWAGEEVSHDMRYYNTSLAARPYSTW